MILSIIIPVYNVELYLAECLDSVFQQNLTDFEVICVNDGSTDNSRIILEKYKKQHPEITIIDQENRGLSAARNAGLKIAIGKYIYFLDSDDYLLPGALKLMISTIESKKTEVVGFNALMNGEIDFVPSLKVDNTIKTGIKYFEHFYKTNRIYPFNNVWLYIYKKSFLNKYKLSFLEGFYHEDIHFTHIVIFYAQKIFFSNNSILYYRKNRCGAITSKLELKKIMDKARIYRKLFEFYKLKGLSNIHLFHSLFLGYITIINQAAANKYLDHKNDFLNRFDLKIMEKGIISFYDYKLFQLVRLNAQLMVLYQRNKLPGIIRRGINIFFSFTNKNYK